MNYADAGRRLVCTRGKATLLNGLVLYSLFCFSPTQKAQAQGSEALFSSVMVHPTDSLIQFYSEQFKGVVRRMRAMGDDIDAKNVQFTRDGNLLFSKSPQNSNEGLFLFTTGSTIKPFSCATQAVIAHRFKHVEQLSAQEHKDSPWEVETEYHQEKPASSTEVQYAQEFCKSTELTKEQQTLIDAKNRKTSDLFDQLVLARTPDRATAEQFMNLIPIRRGTLVPQFRRYVYMLQSIQDEGWKALQSLNTDQQIIAYQRIQVLEITPQIPHSFSQEYQMLLQASERNPTIHRKAVFEFSKVRDFKYNQVLTNLRTLRNSLWASLQNQS